jgi:hypothetical protein
VTASSTDPASTGSVAAPAAPAAAAAAAFPAAAEFLQEQQQPFEAK